MSKKNRILYFYLFLISAISVIITLSNLGLDKSFLGDDYGVSYYFPEKMINLHYYTWDSFYAPGKLAATYTFGFLWGNFIYGLSKLGISSFLIERTNYLLFFVVSGAGALFLINTLVRIHSDINDKNMIYIGSFIGSLLYMLNHFTMYLASIPIGRYQLSYMFLPWVLALFVYNLQIYTSFFGTFLFSLIFLVLMNGNPSNTLTIIILLLAYLAVFWHQISGNSRKYKAFLIGSSIIIVLSCSYISLSILAVGSNPYGKVAFTQDYISSFGFNSVHTSFLNLFRLAGLNTWPNYPYYHIYTENSLFIFLGYLITIISIASLLIPSGNKVKIFFGLVIVGALFFAKGVHPPLKDFSVALIANIPYFDMYRAVYFKFVFFVVLAYSVLMGFFVSEGTFLLQRYYNLSRHVMAPIALIICLYNYPFFKGETIMKDYLTEIPVDYNYAQTIIHNDPHDFNVLSVPPAPGGRGLLLKWRDDNLYIGSHPDMFLLNNPVLDSYWFIAYGLAEGNSWDDLRFEYNVRSILDFSNLLNIKYILLHKDVVESYDFQYGGGVKFLYGKLKARIIKSILNGQDGLELIADSDYYGLYRLSDSNFLPRVYASSTPVLISSDISSLKPLSIASHLGKYPAIAFTERQNKKSLMSAISKHLQKLIDGQQSSSSRSILLANTNFNDLAIDLANAEAAVSQQSETGSTEKAVSSRQSIVYSQKPGAVVLDEKGRGKFKVEDGGIYEFWVKTEGKGLEGIDAIAVEDYKFPTEKKQDRADRWIKFGTAEFKEGKHRIKVVSRKVPVGGQQPEVSSDDKEELKRVIQGTEVVIVSERKREEYEEILKQRGVAYLFYKEEAPENGTQQVIDKRDFYIPDDKIYDITAFIRPRKEAVRAYTINERFEDGTLRNWNLRMAIGRDQSAGTSRQSAVGSQQVAVGGRQSVVSSREFPDSKPLVLFGENFYDPEKLSYPLQEKMWRWMANDGKFVILNPFNTSITVDLSLTAASFEMDRSLDVYVNNKHQETVIVPGPLKRVSKKVLKQIAEVKDLGLASGLPTRIELKALALQPGINEITLSPSPSSTVIGDQNRYAVSIAISDDIRLVPSKPGPNPSPPQADWVNRKGFNARVGDETLILEDNYREKGEEVSWISRPIEKVSLNDYPLFIIKYAWKNTQVQSMDIVFRVDTDGDGQGDAYLVRTLPDPVPGLNRFEIDLLEAVWENFPDALNPYLVGLDLFPHKKWEMDVSGAQGENIQSYLIKGIQLASKEGSVVIKGKESFMGTVFSGKGSYSVSQDADGLSVSLTLGGRKGESASTEANIPLRQRLGGEDSLFVLPYRLKDEHIQNLKVFVSYDQNNDGKADKTVPVGRRIPIPGWKLLTRDMKEPMFLYEATLPSFFPAEYNTAGKRFRNFVVIKNGVPLFPTWASDFVISREQVQVEGVKVTINLPRGADPDDFNYEVFFTPKEWVKESSWFHGFKELVFDIRDLEQDLFEKKVKPVGIKLVLEGKISEAVEQERIYDFEIKAPRYTSSVLPRLSNLSVKENMPGISLDGEALHFNEERVDKEKGGIWINKKVSLQGGEHRLRVVEGGGLEAYLVEVKPVTTHQVPVTSNQTPKIDFKKINPTRYIVNVKDAREPFTLVFSESFHEGWKAYIRRSGGTSRQSAVGRDQSAVGSREGPVGSQRSAVEGQQSAVKTVDYRLSTIDEPWSALWSTWKDRGQRVEIKDHFVVNGYANGWIVDPSAGTSRQSAVSREQSAVGSPQSFEIVLEFKPQRLFEIGLMISGLTLLGCIGYLGYDLVRKRKKRVLQGQST